MTVATVRTGPSQAAMMLLYGGEGLGKTTLGAKMPAPLFFNLEDGIPHGTEVDALPGIDTFPKIMAALRDIYGTDDLPYQTLVIDGLEVVEAMIHRQVCSDNHWANIESAAFGKGYVAAEVLWRQLLGALAAVRKKHGVTILLIGHQSIERVEDPRVPSYTAYAPRLHRKARAIVVDACDIVAFLAHDLRTVTEDQGFGRERSRATASPARYLFLEGRPAFTAKNRHGMPEKLEIGKEFDIRMLTRFLYRPETTTGTATMKPDKPATTTATESTTEKTDA